MMAAFTISAPFFGTSVTAPQNCDTKARRRRGQHVSTPPAHVCVTTPIAVMASGRIPSQQQRQRMGGQRRSTSGGTSGDASWRARNATLVKEMRVNGPDGVLALLREMQTSGAASTQNFNQVVGLLLQDKQFDDAFELAVEAGNLEKANLATFRPLMKYCCSAGNSRMAKRVWRAMAHYGIDGDQFVFAELMGALVRAQDLTAARKVISALRRDGLRPHIVLYNTLLKGYAKTADVQSAFETLEELVRGGVKPDETTFNTVLNTCVRAKDVESLEIVMSKMQEAGVKPGVPTFNTLLKLYARTSNFDNAIAIFNEMQETLEPSIVTYNTLIDGCAHRGDMEYAAKFFDQMVENGHTPDICTMTSLLKGFGRANEPHRAVELFEAMVEGEFEIEDRTRYAVINACLRSSDRVNAKRLMLKMLHDDGFICRSRTYIWMLECDIQADDDLAAAETCDIMLHNNVKVDEAAKFSVIKEMKERGTFFRGLIKASKLEIDRRNQ